jgi:hypothetical protein
MLLRLLLRRIAGMSMTTVDRTDAAGEERVADCPRGDQPEDPPTASRCAWTPFASHGTVGRATLAVMGHAVISSEHDRVRPGSRPIRALSFEPFLPPASMPFRPVVTGPSGSANRLFCLAVQSDGLPR